MDRPTGQLRGSTRLALLASIIALTGCGTAEEITGALFNPPPRQPAISEPEPQLNMLGQGEKLALAGDALIMEGRDLVADGQARIAQGERMAAEGRRIQELARNGHIDTGHHATAGN